MSASPKLGNVIAPNLEWVAKVTEEALEPGLPIVDPHHHLWDWRMRLAHLPPQTHPFEAILRQSPRYLLDELLADTGAGHNVVGTVYVQCGAFYRADGPEAMKPSWRAPDGSGTPRMPTAAPSRPRACAMCWPARRRPTFVTARLPWNSGPPASTGRSPC